MILFKNAFPAKTQKCLMCLELLEEGYFLQFNFQNVIVFQLKLHKNSNLVI